MKTKSILFCFAFALCVNINTSNAQVNVQDSLALVDLYNSTDGLNWTVRDNWLTSSPVSTWVGVVVRNRRVTSISLNYNNLHGDLPSSIGNLIELTELFLYGNHLTGSIPSSIGNLVKLANLYLGNNRLRGSIPSSLGNLVRLEALFLDNNYLSGGIPSFLGNLVKLQFLYLYNNEFSGPIPSSIGNLKNLWFLSLYNNQLSGFIPSSFENLVNLQALSLGKNKLKGSIPSFIGNLVTLEYYLDLSSNRLSGSIPPSFGNLRLLSYLDLHDNRLSGSIPSSVGNLTSLSSLDLHNNRLSGSIPSSLADLHSLNNTDYGLLDLSHNHFTFDGMELIAQTFPNAIYAPQKLIPVHQNDNALSVSAGGTLSNNTYEWFYLGKKLGKKEDSTIIQADSVFDPKKKGMYFVKVTNSVAIQLTLQSDTIYFDKHQQAVIASSENALQEYGKTNLFLVYPNPAKNILYVQTNGSASFSLLNQSGKILLSANINGKGEINVANLAAGLYYLRNNATGAVQKVVVAK